MTYRTDIFNAYTLGQIIRVYCNDHTDGWVNGYVADIGKEFFVLEIFSDTIHLNGFNCIRFNDITGLEVPDPHYQFLEKTIETRNLKRSKSPDLDLSSLRRLLNSAGSVLPIVTLHMKFDDEEDDFEEDLSNVCYIGKIIKVSAEEVTIREITPDGEWEKELSDFELDLIYRVDFGGGYEEALLLVAGSV